MLVKLEVYYKDWKGIFLVGLRSHNEFICIEYNNYDKLSDIPICIHATSVILL
jgi:hypothetical protein